MKALPALTLVAFVLAVPARADVVFLTNGSQVEGRVTDHGDEISVSLRFGEMRVPKSRVSMIERKSSLEEQYEARIAKLDPKDADARVALGAWLEERQWGTQARREYRAALVVAPEHRGAHEALGHLLHEGRWRSEREVMELRGFVRAGGKWVTAEEARRQRSAAERAQLERERLRERRALERRLNSLFRDVALGSQRRCDAAYEELVLIAREERIAGLEVFAAEARDYYDGFWTALRRQRDTLVDARVTMTKLKRPIRSVSTGLGSSTSPVSLQLPEMSVVSVRSTLVIPAGRGKP